MLWKLKGKTLDLSQSGVIMGILNLTPDSFSDGGELGSVDAAYERAWQHIDEGAGILDLGGESTRPGASSVPVELEIKRTIPLLKLLRKEWSGLLSIDTSKPEVAREALFAGADIVNDVSGFCNKEMRGLVAEYKAGAVVMHMQGKPRTMQQNPQYKNVIKEVKSFFFNRMEALRVQGVEPEQVVFDPGIGFGKTLEHNLQLLQSPVELETCSRPLLYGLSRKSFIAKLLGDDRVELRNWPTVALTANLRQKGVMLHRVHQVRENLHALRMTEALLGGGTASK